MPDVNLENDKLAILFEQYLSGRMSRAERTELRILLQDPANQEYFENLVNSSLSERRNPPVADPDKDIHIQHLLDKIHTQPAPALSPVRILKTNHQQRSAWFRSGRNLRWAAAAVILLMIGAGSYLWLQLSHTGQPLATAGNGAGFENVEAAKDKAILTLSDGSTVALDDTGNGTIARQGNTQIVKLANGRIIYNPDPSLPVNTEMNTMSTPAGGKYQLTLPDGTRVWLNACSSITFPVAFTGNERTVKITGEAYFEVAADKTRPFSVTKENTRILVLGTDFNVNSYDDEKNLKITLLNGSVKISNAKNRKSALLVPGQQAQLNDESLLIINGADIARVMAWKNGLFNFEDASFDEVMRQVSRWYNIKVTYEKGVPNIQLWGKMSRNTNLSGLLKNLKDVGVKYRVNEEKRELTILPE